MKILSSWRRIPERLGRVTTQGRLIGEIDGLRLLAILPVILQHSSERMLDQAPAVMADSTAAYVVSRGTVGVFLFFAISGFILSLPFARMHLGETGRVPLRKYLLRRVTRLEPPYILWMTFFALVLLLQGAMPLHELAGHYAASIGYVHSLLYGSYTPINPVAWSLEIEIQFYLLAPLLAAAFFAVKDRRRQWVTGLVLLAFMGLQHALGWTHYPYKLTLLGQLQHFWVGFILADDYLHRFRQATPRSYAWDLLGIGGGVLMLLMWSEEWGKSLAFTAGLYLLFQGAFRGRLLGLFLRNPWATAIGGMCYTIYLIHLPLLELQYRFTDDWIAGTAYLPAFALQLLVSLPVVLGLSALFFLFIEKPCMDPDWPRHLLHWLRHPWGLRTDDKRTVIQDT
ncbi:MAG: acyltransferase [Bacteroidia bacterium]